MNASLLLPLWEVPGEAAAVRDAQAWAGGPTGGPALLTGAGVAPTPPLPRALLALGLRAAGLAGTQFLARPHRAALPHEAALHLHGPDERLPFAGPARGLHLLRLASVAWGLLAVLGTHALALRLLPGRPRAALLAAALCAFHPTLLVAMGSLAPAAPAAALLAWSLVALADLARGARAARRQGLLAGGLLGLTFLCGVRAAALLPLAPLALLLLRAPGSPWRHALRPLDAVAAGLLVVTGPWIAWSLAAGADPLPGGARPPDAPLTLATVAGAWLPRLAFGFVGLPAGRLSVGPAMLLAWTSLAGLAAAGLARALLRARRATWLDARLAALLLATLLLLVLALLPDAGAAGGHDLLAGAGPFGALLAAGAAAWLPAARRRLGAALGALLVAGLAALAAHEQAFRLGPAFHPLNRVQDPHLLCFDPLAGVPAGQRLATVSVVHPRDGATLDEAPELRWLPVNDPGTRYSVHLLTPGAAFAIRTFEAEGLSLRDRFRVPDEVWQRLPPGVELELRAVRLPALDEALSEAPLLVDETPPVRVRRRGNAPAR